MTTQDYANDTRFREVDRDTYYASLNPITSEDYDTVFPVEEDGEKRFAVGTTFVNRQLFCRRISDGYMIAPTRYFLAK